MDFTGWLTTWLTRHPLKAPPELGQARYTAEVMAKIKAMAPARSPVGMSQWLSWPRLALAGVGAAGVLMLLVVNASRSSQVPLAERLTQAAQTLAEVDEPLPELMNGQAVTELAQDLEAEDHQLILAESSASQEQQWLDQTLELLDQLDEDVPGVNSDEPSGNDEEEWLKELDTLDEGPSAASS